MSDQSSAYSVLENVPLMISPQYKLPKKIVIDQELQPIPRDLTQIIAYPFSIEKKILANIEASRTRSKEEEDVLRAKQLVYEQEKENLRKAAAKKIAPGFLDTDTRILKPEEKATVSSKTFVRPRLQSLFDKPLGKPNSEEDSSTTNPWNSPKADYNALRSILDTQTNHYTPTYTLLPIRTAYSPSMKPDRAKDNCWKIRNNTVSGSAPNVPPKQFDEPVSFSTGTTSVASSLPPEHLIEELNNMGFARAQAVDALQKNQNDLTKATNFLLDQA